MRRVQPGAGSLLAAACWLAVAGLPPASAAADPLGVGFVYVGPAADAGWSHQHDLGRRELEAALGDKVKATVVESVAEGADSEPVIRQLAAEGNRLIFTTSFGFINQTLEVAKAFPNVFFENATGNRRAGNVATYSARFYEGRYLAGIVAGRMTRSNILGYVAPFPIPEVVQDIDAYMLGARSVNPKAAIKVAWTNAWYDPDKEREATDSLVGQGADVVTHDTDSTAVVKAAEAKGVWSIGYNSDMAKYGPKTELTAVTMSWGRYYIHEAEAVLAGSWKSHDVWGGIKDGMVGLAPFNAAVPKAVVAEIAAKEEAIVAGRLVPFRGPIRDQSGKVRVRAGRALDDAELRRLDWYVAGVEGKLPK